ncbi:MAG: APC family permease [Saprospirales bacterium]|nr:APC family permease [Saprospirales bacterium]
MSGSSKLEIITVWGKLFVLFRLVLVCAPAWGPTSWYGHRTSPEDTALGAATIFMAYEGFQLLSYDYEDIKNPQKTLPRATISAVIAVIAIYVLVAFAKPDRTGGGGPGPAGGPGAGRAPPGGRARRPPPPPPPPRPPPPPQEGVAKKKDLPYFLAKENQANIPYYAILVIGGMGALLAVIGSLSTLVDAASRLPPTGGQFSGLSAKGDVSLVFHGWRIRMPGRDRAFLLCAMERKSRPPDRRAGCLLPCRRPYLSDEWMSLTDVALTPLGLIL